MVAELTSEEKKKLAAEQPAEAGFKIELEKLPEKKDEIEKIKKAAPEIETKPPALAAPISAPISAPIEKDPDLKKIEDILAENLTDIFLSMPEDKKMLFKTKGEETASKIKTIIQSGKKQVMKIFQLIREWLKIIPGINKFFLDREAKIKADKIMKEFEKTPSSKNEIL